MGELYQMAIRHTLPSEILSRLRYRIGGSSFHSGERLPEDQVEQCNDVSVYVSAKGGMSNIWPTERLCATFGDVGSIDRLSCGKRHPNDGGGYQDKVGVYEAQHPCGV